VGLIPLSEQNINQPQIFENLRLIFISEIVFDKSAATFYKACEKDL